MGRAAAAVVLLIVPLAGCAAVGPVVTALTSAGVAGGVTSATGSAVAGIAAGVGASYAVDQGVDWGERHIEDQVQKAVALAAGPLAPGQSAPWHVIAAFPFSGRDGTVEVARDFGQSIPCKDIVFSRADDDKHNIFTGTVCRNDLGEWRWAAAEPSTHRWDYLQD